MVSLLAPWLPREVWPHDSFGQAGMSPEEELETLHVIFMETQGACMATSAVLSTAVISYAPSHKLES